MPVIELPGALGELLKALMDGRERGEQDADDASEHEVSNCNCSVCQMQRFQVPVPPPIDSDEYTSRLLDAMKVLAETGRRTSKAMGKWKFELVVNPMHPEHEDIILQFVLNRMQTAHDALLALNQLLPADRRAPLDVLPLQMPRLEVARAELAESRRVTQEKLDAKRAEQEARQAAREAVKETANAPTATANTP